MAIQYPQEWADEELMSKSVMDAPRSIPQKIGDAVFGRTPKEWFTNAFTNLPVAKYDILDKDLIKPFYRGLDLLPKRLADWLQNTPNVYKYNIDRNIGPAGLFQPAERLISFNPSHRDVLSGRLRPLDVLNHETVHGLVRDVNKYGIKPPGLEMPIDDFKYLQNFLQSEYPTLSGNDLYKHVVNEYLPIHLGGGKAAGWNMQVDYPLLQETYKNWWPK